MPEAPIRGIAGTPTTHAAAPAPRKWTWQRITHHALMVGAIGSIAVHVVIGMVAFMVWLRGPAQPSAGRFGDGPIGLAVMTEGELASLAGGPQGDESLPSIAAPSEPTDQRLPGPPSDEMSEIKGGGASDATSGLVGGGDLGNGGEGIGVGGGGGGGGGASFYGVEASGSRFAFIVDVSGSMGFDGRIEELRRQLDISVSEMSEASSYCILAFSDDYEVLGGRLEWTLAGQTNKNVTRSIVRELSPKNSTHAFTAFQAVYKLKPRPDAIYFMTDGEVQDADQIWTLLTAQARQGKVPIHTICFVEQKSADWMKKLADTTGGKFTCVRCK